MKKASIIFIFLSLSMSLFATTWTWSSDYINVTNYRYQLGGEEEKGWTVVPASITSYTSTSDEDAILYVQQSLDNGFSWSPSGQAVYIKEPTTVVPTESELVSEDDIKDVVIELNERVAKAFSVGFALSPLYERVLDISYAYPSYDAIGAELEFSLKNLLSVGAFGFGVNLDIGAILTPWNDFSFEWIGNMFGPNKTLYRYYSDILFDFSYGISKFDINCEIGGGASLLGQTGIGVFDVGSSSLVPSLAASFGLDYNFTDNFCMGIEVKYHYDIKPQAHRLSGLLKIGVNL